MKRSAIHLTSREPIDRRQLRLIHALLAFPVAGVIGFTGNAIVKGVLTDSPAITAPAPERTTDEHKAPSEGGDDSDTNDSRLSVSVALWLA